MRIALTIVAAGMLFAATLAFADAAPGAAEPAPAEPAPVARALSGSDILANLRQIGLNPIGEPVLRGPYYVMHAFDPRGIEMRVVVDARFGDILSVLPARPLNAVYAPQYERAPRIIHVPPRGEHGGDAVQDEPLPPASVDDDENPAVPQRPEQKEMPKSRKGAQAPVPRRAVLGAPPAADASATPINPADRFAAPAGNGEQLPPPLPPSVPPKTTP